MITDSTFSFSLPLGLFLTFLHTQFSSDQFSRLVVYHSLRPHEPQHGRLPCPSPTPGVHPNPYPLSRWCHPTISSSVVPFSCLQPFPASGSFPVSQLFTSGGQKVLELQLQHQSLQWICRVDFLFKIDWFDLAVQGTLKGLFEDHNSKASVLRHSAFFML